MWHAVVLLLSMAYWAVGGLLFVLAGALLVPVLPVEKSRALGQWLLSMAFRLFLACLRACGVYECEYIGFEALRDVKGGLIIAPNHPALWDAVFILSKVHGLRCILKASLMHNPFLRGGAKLAGFIPNKPAHKMLQHSIEALRQGDRLLFFPEGTRTRKEETCINSLQGGLGIIATQSSAPVWPVFIETNSDYLSKGWPLWQLPDKKIRMRITLGEPLASPPDEGAAEFTRRLQEVFAATLGGGPKT
ncbi:lysophospholipid acyltransferase family protein [Prosthecobacter sp.]|uniref:lysophospholipid acyltransferase family protein n=1 Tax=Prosthecobacter sp. TaxID=1965333 RepID=UPI0037848415